MENETKKQVREYHPGDFLDSLLEKLRLKNDAALVRVLEINLPVSSKIRHGRLAFGGALLIRIYEVSGLNIADLLSLLEDRRKKYRVSDVHDRPKAVQTSSIIRSYSLAVWFYSAKSSR